VNSSFANRALGSRCGRCRQFSARAGSVSTCYVVIGCEGGPVAELADTGTSVPHHLLDAGFHNDTRTVQFLAKGAGRRVRLRGLATARHTSTSRVASTRKALPQIGVELYCLPTISLESHYAGPCGLLVRGSNSEVAQPEPAALARSLLAHRNSVSGPSADQRSGW